MKRRWFLTILVPVAAGVIVAAPVVFSAAAPASLERAAQAMEGEFQRLDAGLQRAARTLGTTALTPIPPSCGADA